MISPSVEHVIYSYSEWQPLYDKMRDVIFVEGFVPLSRCKQNTLLIIDDQMEQLSPLVADIFTKGSHHKKISVCVITQNLFHHNKQMRTITLNAHYLILFKSPRDKSAISTLASQMYPGKAQFLKMIFTDATKDPHSYLLIDLKQQTPDYLRLRTNIFPGEVNFVYMDKNEYVGEMTSV